MRIGALLVAVTFVLGACGGDGDTDDADTPAATTTTAPSAATTSTTAGEPTTGRTSQFLVAFAVELPGGWQLVERNPEVAQIFRRCGDCTHEGEELGELSFDLSDTTTPPADLAAQLAASPSIDASAVEPWTGGDLTGVRFTATRIRAAAPNFPVSGYRSEAAGEPIDVYVVAADGKTMTIFVDPHEAKGADAETFRATAATILASVDLSL